MPRRVRRILGLALDDRGLTAAEARVVGGRAVLIGSAALAAEGRLSLDDPLALGRALRDRLREARLSARRAVLGVPASWLLFREQTFPPSDESTFVQMVRLTAEQMSTDSGRDLSCAYQANAGADGGRRVMIVAIERGRLQALARLAKAAGLDIAAVTPTILALGAVAPKGEDAEWTVYAAPGYAEAVRGDAAGPSVVRRFSLDGADEAGSRAQSLANGLRQSIALLPRDDEGAPTGGIHVWDDAGLGDDGLWRLHERLGVAVTFAEEPASLSPDAEEGRASAAAVGLALAGLTRGGAALDLSRSRLTRREGPAVGRTALLAGLALVVLAALGLSLGQDWRREQEALGGLRARLAELAPDIGTAEDVVSKIGLVREWHDRRPPFLDCLRRITLAFPEQGDIWATSIGLREDLRAVISGKALNEEAVLRLRERLAGSPAFRDVRLLHLRQAGGGRGELSFAIQLKYAGSE